MPAPLLPLVGKLLIAGAGFAAGTDLYKRGKEMVKENAPIAFGGIKEGLGGFWDKVTDVLDPLDLSGQRKAREEQALDEARGEEKSRAKKKLAKERAAAAKKSNDLLAAERAAAAERIKAIEKSANDRLAHADAQAKSTIATIRQQGEQALKVAKDELRRIKALRAADSAARNAPEDSSIKEIMANVISAVASGAHLPDVEVYADMASETGIPIDLDPAEAEAQFVSDWAEVL